MAANTVGHTVPFVAAAVVLMALQPLAFPVAIVALAHAWIIPALFAQRGANVLRPRPRAGRRPASGVRSACSATSSATTRASCTSAAGLVLERGALGTWLVGEAGAVLVRGRQVCCYCVKVDDPTLPSADRIAHLLLALRADERGFATVANLTLQRAGVAAAGEDARAQMRPAPWSSAAQDRRSNRGSRALWPVVQ